MNKQVLVTIGGVVFTSRVVSEFDARRLLDVLYPNFSEQSVSIVNPAERVEPVPVTTPTKDSTVYAQNFTALDVKSVIHRADDILAALKNLQLKDDQLINLANNMSTRELDMDLDRWEQTAWMLVRLELNDRKTLEGPGHQTNGGF